MKKTKAIFAVILALVLCIGLFAGCTKPEKGPALTEGIFVCAADESHKEIIKFKEDGTFYAQGVTQQKAYIGVYELVDMEVEYLDAGDDGVWAVADDSSELQKSSKAIVMYESDGTTPLAMRADPEDVEMNAGIEANILAYADGKLYNVSIDGYTRTLTQDTTSTFSVDDEIKNLLYSFMPEELPEWAAAAGYGIDELKFDLYHNSWEDLATSEELSSGVYTGIEGNVYTLDNGAVITVAEDGKTAVYVNGDTTVALVEWVDSSVAEGNILLTTGEASLFSGAVTTKVVFYRDGTLEVIANGATAIAEASWTLDTATHQITFSDVSNGALEYTLGQDVTITWTGIVSEQVPGEQVAEMTFPATDLALLLNTGATELLTTGEASLFSGAVTTKVVFYSDGTLEVIANGTTVIAEAGWTLDAATYQISFSDVTNGTLGFTMAQDIVITWTGVVSEQVPGEQVAEMAFPAADLALLQG